MFNDFVRKRRRIDVLLDQIRRNLALAEAGNFYLWCKMFECKRLGGLNFAFFKRHRNLGACFAQFFRSIFHNYLV